MFRKEAVLKGYTLFSLVEMALVFLIFRRCWLDCQWQLSSPTTKMYEEMTDYKYSSASILWVFDA